MVIQNDGFGIPEGAIPPAEAKQEPETAAQRVARLRAKAEAQAVAEFDEDAVYARLLAEARANRIGELLPENTTELPTDTQGFPEDYVRVRIFRGQNAFDLSYVPLGIGGFVIKVPRDEEVILPRVFVTECLDHAVEEITIKSQGGLITRPAHRFPYSLLGVATKEEYQAFQRSQKDKAERQIAQAA